MGARPLSRVIDTEIKSPLSRRVLFGDLVDGGKVSVSIDGDQLVFTVSPNAPAKEKKNDVSEAVPNQELEDERVDD